MTRHIVGPRPRKKPTKPSSTWIRLTVFQNPLFIVPRFQITKLELGRTEITLYYLIPRHTYPYVGSVARETCCLVRITSSGCNAVLEINAESDPITGDPIKVINHSVPSIMRLDSKAQHKVRNTNCAQFVGFWAFVKTLAFERTRRSILWMIGWWDGGGHLAQWQGAAWTENSETLQELGSFGLKLQYVFYHMCDGIKCWDYFKELIRVTTKNWQWEPKGKKLPLAQPPKNRPLEANGFASVRVTIV